ncbi:MAG: response regulator [Bacteroidetes bacterium]|nr:response regulator [Bacteroidota bacterium]
MAHRYRPHSNGRNGGPICVLLVEPDDVLAEAMQQHLSERLPDVVAMRCSTLASARAYLSGNPFDAVLMAHELPDGSGLDLLDLRATLGLESYFFTHKRGCLRSSNEGRSYGLFRADARIREPRRYRFRIEPSTGYDR